MPLDVACRGALPHPVVRAERRRSADLTDVHRAVAIQDRDVHRLLEIGGQRLADLTSLLSDVQLRCGGAGQAHDAEAQPVLAPIGQLLDEARLSSTATSRKAVDLCTPSSRHLRDASLPVCRKDLQDT